MSIATLNGGRGIVRSIEWPEGLKYNNSFGFTAITAAAHYRAFSFIVPKNGNLARFHFRTGGSVTTGDTLHISFQDANADGTPDGTPDQYRTISITTGQINTWFRTELVTSDGTNGGALRAVTAGQRVVVVIRYDSYVSGNMWLSTLANSSFSGVNGLFTSTNSGSSWTWALQDFPCAIEYDDGTFAYLNNVSPVTTFASSSIGSGSTPDEYSLRFRLPFPVRVIGASVVAASTDTEIGLYPDSGAALGTGVPTILNTTAFVDRSVYFSSAVDLAANTWYRISWKPTTATVRSIPVYSMYSAAIRECFPLGTNFALGTRVDGGSWTDDDTKFILASLLTTGFDDGAGGGGGSCSYGALSNGTRVIPVAQ